MSLPSRSEYAALAVYELALAYHSAKPLSAQKIADKYQLSTNFLIRTLQALRKAKLVETVRGAQGGFRLLASPEEITLGYVLSLAESESKQATDEKDSTEPLKSGRQKSTTRSSKTARSPREPIRRKLDSVWEEAETKRQEFLNGILFSDLIQKESPQPPTLHFSI